MALAHLSIGSNIGERKYYLEEALMAVEVKIGHIVSKSFIYESQSWGYQGQNFLNMVIKVETTLAPSEILKAIHQIESGFGRVKVTGIYTDRPIDLDIIFYEDIIINIENLIIPHPKMQNRLFVLIPLFDIDPEYIHPVFNKNIRQLRDKCMDKGWIKLYDEIK